MNAIKSYIDETSQILSALADKNLDVSIRREYLGDFAQMKQSINVFTDALNEIFIEMGASSQEIAAGSNEVQAYPSLYQQGLLSRQVPLKKSHHPCMKFPIKPSSMLKGQQRLRTLQVRFVTKLKVVKVR